MTVLSLTTAASLRPAPRSRPQTFGHTFSKTAGGQSCTKQKLRVLLRGSAFNSDHDLVCETEECDDVARRAFIAGVALFALNTGISTASVALADEVLVEYEDNVAGFSLSYPKGWTASEIETPERSYIAERTLVWYPKDVPPRDVNVTLLINNAAADYTKLGSFGTAEDFGTNLVNSMDRSFLKRAMRSKIGNDEDVQTAKLVDAKSTRGMYSIEYLLKKPKEEEKRLLSLVALRYDGVYNRLYTLTAQCSEADFPKYREEFQAILSSFKPPEGTA